MGRGLAVIETESQRQAAMSWVRYWRASVSAGQQSWLGQEQAQETLMALHKQVDAYDKRVRASTIGSLSDDVRAAAHDVAVTERASRSGLREEELLLTDGVTTLVEPLRTAPSPQAIGSLALVEKGIES
jgi:hypothetical protein